MVEKAKKAKKAYTYLALDGLTTWAVRWLYFDLAVNLLNGLVSVLIIRDVSRLDLHLPSDTPLPSDLIVAVTASVLLVSFLVTAVVVLKWIYRADRNIHSRVKSAEVTPPWAVGFYFVPVFSLWKPFQAMREIWQVSANPESWRKVPVPNHLRWWWGLYLLSNVIAQGSVRTLRGDTLQYTLLGAQLDVADALITIPLTLILVSMIRRIHAGQAAWPPATETVMP